MVLLWFVLYIGARIGKTKGQPEMHQLYNFMKETLRANY